MRKKEIVDIVGGEKPRAGTNSKWQTGRNNNSISVSV